MKSKRKKTALVRYKINLDNLGEFFLAQDTQRFWYVLLAPYVTGSLPL